MLSKDAEKKKINRSLRYSILDGSFWSIMAGFGEYYLQPFAVFLKATNLQLGLLSSLPLLIGNIAQLFSRKALEIFKSKREIVTLFAFLQGLTWIGFAYLVYAKTSNIVWYLLALMILYFGLGMFVSPIWSAWMGRLVDVNIRGKYFANRNKIAGFVSFAAFITAGIFLWYSELVYNSPKLAYFILFVIAFFARCFSVMYLSKQYEPEDGFKAEHVPLTTFFKEVTKTNYGYLVIYLALTNFALYIAAPFFAVYMFNDLHFSYLDFMVITGTALIVKFMFMPVWGKLADKYGSLKVLSFSGYFIPLMPILWIFSTNFYYLIFTQIVSGMIWAGFELCSFNFILDTTLPSKRVQYISYFNTFNGILIVLGSLAGAFILKYNHLFWSQYWTVFLASGILRYAVAFVMIPKLKEVRIVKSIDYKRMFWKIISAIPPLSLYYAELPIIYLSKVVDYTSDKFDNHIKKKIIEGIRKM